LCSNESMRWAVLPAVLLAGSASAEVQVHLTNGRIDLKATGAPLSEVLDRLAKQTGMKVTYDGAPQRVPVNLTLADRTPAQAVLGVLDGLGLNYALRMDVSGTRVEALMIAGTAAASPGAPLPAPAQAAPAYRPPEPMAEPEEDAQAEDDAGADDGTDANAEGGVPLSPGIQPTLPNAPGNGPAGAAGATTPTNVDTPSRAFGPGMLGIPKGAPTFPSPLSPPTPPFLGSQPPGAPPQTQPPAQDDDSTQ
jgi:hypothetical protein